MDVKKKCSINKRLLFYTVYIKYYVCICNCHVIIVRIFALIRQQVFLCAVHVGKRGSDLWADGSDGVRSENVSFAPRNGYMSSTPSVSSCCITSIHPGGSVWSRNVLTPWSPNLITETHLQLNLSESTNAASYLLIWLYLYCFYCF